MSNGEQESLQTCEVYSRSARNKARHMNCGQLLDKINELTDSERIGRTGTKGLNQRFRDYVGDDATHGPKILEQQRALRTYIDEYISRGDCGDPPSGSVEIAERRLPAREPQSTDNSAREMIETAAVVGGGGLALGYLTYRAIRMLPSLLPPLWPTIPANLAIP